MTSVAFVASTWPLGWICFALSPVALAIVFWYSLAKRVTSYTQFFLGLAMAVAPVGGWLAAGGGLAWPPFWLALAIGTWVGGFDVLYACQDVAFDRAHGLRSIPVRFGVGRSLLISRALHVATVGCLCALGVIRPLGPIYFAGVAAGRAAPRLRADAGARGRSLAGQARLRPERLRRHPLSRDDEPRGVPAMTHVALGITGASGAVYAVRTLAALLAHGATVELVVSDYGRRLLRDEVGPDAAIDRLGTYVTSRYGVAVEPGRLVVHSNRDLGASLASGSQGCEAMVIVPCSMKTLAGIAHGLSRSLIERAADVMLKERRPLVIVPRETPLSLPQLKNLVLCAEAGAIVVPAMPAFYQQPRTLDDLADFMAGKVLSVLGIPHALYPAWTGEVQAAQPATRR